MRKFILILVLISSVMSLVYGIVELLLGLIFASIVSIALVLSIMSNEKKIIRLQLEVRTIRESLRRRDRAKRN